MPLISAVIAVSEHTKALIKLKPSSWHKSLGVALGLACLWPSSSLAQVGQSVGPIVINPSLQEATKLSNGVFVLSDGVTVILRQRGKYLMGVKLLVSEKLSDTQDKAATAVVSTQKSESEKQNTAPISGLALERLSHWAGVMTGYGAKVQKPLQELLGRPEVQKKLEQEPFTVMADPLQIIVKRKKSVISVDISLQKVATESFSTTGQLLVGPTHNTPLTVRIFSDFQCPFCQKFEQETMPKLLKILPSNTRLEFHHFPLDRLHPTARSASEISQCAAAQGKFASYKDALFERSNWETWQKGNPNTVFLQIAQQQGLEMQSFKNCIAERSGKEAVDKSVELASKIGVNATPTVFVGGYRLNNPNDLKRLIELLSLINATEGTTKR